MNFNTIRKLLLTLAAAIITGLPQMSNVLADNRVRPMHQQQMCNDQRELQSLVERSLEIRYPFRHQKVDNVKILKCMWKNESGRIIYTLSANQRPFYGISRLYENRDHSLKLGGGFGCPIIGDRALTHDMISSGETHTQISGQVHDDSIVRVRIKLGWVPLWEVPVMHKHLYFIQVPLALNDMREYVYMYSEGIDRNGRVVANTKLTNLKDHSLTLYFKATFHGLVAKATRIHPDIIDAT